MSILCPEWFWFSGSNHRAPRSRCRSSMGWRHPWWGLSEWPGSIWTGGESLDLLPATKQTAQACKWSGHPRGLSGLPTISHPSTPENVTEEQCNKQRERQRTVQRKMHFRYSIQKAIYYYRDWEQREDSRFCFNGPFQDKHFKNRFTKDKFLK